MSDDRIAEALSRHPCYNEDAHKKFARIHLPVAPRCNIQCNYCNRKYDCSNESRPGVTSEILTPEEALEKVRLVKEKIPELSVVAIAGPGDPLANEETFETFDLLAKEFPDLTLCVSTNGLMLPTYARRIYDLGIRFVTVTMNACDPDVSKDIYSSVIWNGERLTGRDAAERLLTNQLDGISECARLGIVLKINIVLIPGINDVHIPDLVKKVKSMGAYIVNILPLIPVEGTRFSDRRSPTPEERRRLMDLCSNDARMMRHCRQCRADAIGLLDNDRSDEFRPRPCGSGCGPKPIGPGCSESLNDEAIIALASSDGKTVDCGFGNSPSFRIIASDGNTTRTLRTVTIDLSGSVSGSTHSERIDRIISDLGRIDAVVVSEIGHMPESRLSSKGIVVSIADGDVDSTAMEVAKTVMANRRQ